MTVYVFNLALWNAALSRVDHTQTRVPTQRVSSVVFRPVCLNSSVEGELGTVAYEPVGVDCIAWSVARVSMIQPWQLPFLFTWK